MELMIVLAIISLLSSFAYLAYSRYWLHQKRLEGRLVLLEASIALEKYAMHSHEGYMGSNLSSLRLKETREHGWYQLKLVEANEAQHKLIAKPTFKDIACSELSCHATNEHFHQGSGSYYDCWGY